MDFELTDYIISDDVRLKTVIDGKTVFIIITKEACEDDLKEGLTPDKKIKLEKIVNDRLAFGQLVLRPDNVNELVEVVLIKTGDLA